MVGTCIFYLILMKSKDENRPAAAPERDRELWIAAK